MIYYFPLIICLLYVAIDRKNLENVLLYILLTVIVLIYGLRWETGTDWLPYFNWYEYELWSSGSYLANDTGFFWYSVLLKNLDLGYSFFLTFNALFFYLALLKTTKKTMKYPVVAFMLIYSCVLPYMGMERQLFAMGFALFYLLAILDKKYLLALMYLFIAFNFHKSVLILLPILFINNKSIFITIVLLQFLLFIFLLQFGFFTNYLEMYIASFGSQAGRYQIYLSNLYDTNISSIGLIRRILFFLIFFMINPLNISEEFREKFILFRRVYIIGLMFFIIFSITLPIMIGRGLLYYTVFEFLLLALVVSNLRLNNNRYMYNLLMVFFSIIYLWNGLLFFNDLFNPYCSLVEYNCREELY